MLLNVKELRERLGLSQQALAEATGIPKGRINNWELGKGKPKAEDTEILLRLARTMVQDKVESLLDYRDEMIALLKEKIEQLQIKLDECERKKSR